MKLLFMMTLMGGYPCLSAMTDLQLWIVLDYNIFSWNKYRTSDMDFIGGAPVVPNIGKVQHIIVAKL